MAEPGQSSTSDGGCRSSNHQVASGCCAAGRDSLDQSAGTNTDCCTAEEIAVQQAVRSTGDCCKAADQVPKQTTQLPDAYASDGEACPKQANRPANVSCCSGKQNEIIISKGCCAEVATGEPNNERTCAGPNEPAAKSKGAKAEPCRKCDRMIDAGVKRCCDDSCLTRIAIRECRDECCSGRDTKSISGEPSGPCKAHLDSAKERFNPTLEALGCICRALLALNLESCCATTSRQSSVSSLRARLRASRALTRKSSSHGSSLNAASGRCSMEIAIGSGCCEASNESCCDGGQATNTKHAALAFAKTCCSDPKAQAPSIRSSGAPPLDTRKASCVSNQGCQENCCIEQPKAVTTNVVSQVATAPNLLGDGDLEKGTADWEHVVLAIQGMTCTGCETKLNRTLASIQGISGLRTSLVLSRAEFDINVGSISTKEVIAHLQRTTDFECALVSNKGHELELTVDDNTDECINWGLPSGILAVSKATKNTIRVSYDPMLLGARDLVHKAFGQPLQLAPLRPDPSIAAGNKHVWHVGLMTLLSACLTIPVLVFEWAPLPPHETVYGSVSLALATIIQVFIAGPFYPAAIKSLIFVRVIEMDLLIVLSTTAAYVFSVIAFSLLMAGRPLSTGEFFETSTLLVTLIMLGRFVSALARQKAVESISIRSLQQPAALLVVHEDRGIKKIDARLLQYGDIIRIMPETRVVTDGTVISGESEVDESMVTGEALPIEKKKASVLIAGSVNGSGTLDVRVTQLPGDNTISAIANMVDEAKLSKPKVQELADRVAGYFVPAVVALAIITFVIWMAVGVGGQHLAAPEAAVQAITYSIAVLIISCPCAIGLAVPMVIVIAGQVAANRGVIFKSAETVEIARKTRHVVFDKTGTLTQGKLKVVDVQYFDTRVEQTKSELLGVLSDVKHPVAVAVAEHLRLGGIKTTLTRSVKILPGKGVEGFVDTKSIRAGNTAWLGIDAHPAAMALLSQGYTVFAATVNNALVALFSLQDTPRPEATRIISILAARSVSVSLVSGDDPGAVADVASALGIAVANTRARCSPADKAAYVRALLTADDDDDPGTVLFLGDGTNDAPALAAASVGVHMGDGSDVARGAADVVLAHPDLGGLLVLMDLSRAVVARVALNFAWAGVYNLFAVLLAGGAFVKVRIPPAYAGLGEIVSVLPVVLVAVGLKWARLDGARAG